MFEGGKINLKSKPFMTPEKLRYHAEILSNRVKTRFRHLSRKYKKQNLDVFRLYDWDIPEVRAVIDWYAGHLVIAEYERKQIGPEWLPAMAKAVGEALSVPTQNIHMKRRHTKTDTGVRYSRMSSKGKRFVVNEHDLKFWVNLDDFLDTGLYSDHRDTRQLVRKWVTGKSFLNLFAYTGAFSCAAALGGAVKTVTVDRSADYINWAEENFKLNGCWGAQHLLLKSDVDKFLERAHREGQKFDIVFVDPPSFFKDVKQDVAFDINRDHPELIDNVSKVVSPGGTLIFSTNHQRFEPQFHGLPVKDIVELTPKTIPEDYRNKKVHRCWKMTV